jgi:hypothetical protein
MSPVADVSGDPNVYGSVYVSTKNGFVWGQFNYLLNRDLNPANGNSPVGLNEAA